MRSNRSLMARASHTHPVFGDDSSNIFHLMEEATRGTPIALTTATYNRTRDRRGANFAVMAQHAGIDK